MLTERRKTMKTVKSNVFAMMIAGCLATCAFTGGCASDKTSSTEPLAEVPSSSPKPFADKGDSVTSWKFYNKDKDTIRVLGENSSGKVVAELLVTVDANDKHEAQEVTVETVSPERSSVRFKPGNDGRGAIEKSTAEALTSMHVFDSLDEDVKSYSAAGAQGPHARGLSWDCVSATLAMVGACGATAATCVETAGLGCALGGAGCLATVHDYYDSCD
jgi:copper(I)-binding protein